MSHFLDSSQPSECPLCMEEFDMTDRNLKPCKCGYQICLWCLNRMMECAEGDAKCPNCRRPYDQKNFDFKPLDPQELKAEKSKRRSRKKQSQKSRKALSNVRVIQRNLVYVVGLTLNVANERFLASKENFAKYGKISKLVVNTTNLQRAAAQGREPTVSAYITYERSEDAARAIRAVDSTWIDGKMLRASFGTTKYCAYFLRNIQCTNPDCMYLHEYGHEEDTFTKDDIVLRNGLPTPSNNDGHPDLYAALKEGESVPKHHWNYPRSNQPPSGQQQAHVRQPYSSVSSPDQHSFWDTADLNGGDYEGYTDDYYHYDDEPIHESNQSPSTTQLEQPAVVVANNSECSASKPKVAVASSNKKKDFSLPSTARWGIQANNSPGSTNQRDNTSNNKNTSSSSHGPFSHTTHGDESKVPNSQAHMATSHLPNLHTSHTSTPEADTSSATSKPDTIQPVEPATAESLKQQSSKSKKAKKKNKKAKKSSPPKEDFLKRPPVSSIQEPQFDKPASKLNQQTNAQQTQRKQTASDDEKKAQEGASPIHLLNNGSAPIASSAQPQPQTQSNINKSPLGLFGEEQSNAFPGLNGQQQNTNQMPPGYFQDNPNQNMPPGGFLSGNPPQQDTNAPPLWSTPPNLAQQQPQQDSQLTQSRFASFDDNQQQQQQNMQHSPFGQPSYAPQQNQHRDMQETLRSLLPNVKVNFSFSNDHQEQPPLLQSDMQNPWNNQQHQMNMYNNNSAGGHMQNNGFNNGFNNQGSYAQPWGSGFSHSSNQQQQQQPFFQ